MNRKQRRGATRQGAGPASRLPAAPTPAAVYAEQFNAAVMYHNAGRLDEAERRYRQVIAALPQHAEALSRLGAVMMRQGRPAEAIAHMERGLAVKPDMFEAYANLAQAYMWTGQRERAIEAACRALELREIPQSRAMFAQCVGFARFATDDGRYRKFVLRALVEGWVRPRELAGVAISLIKASRATKDAIALADATQPERAPARELFAAAQIVALSRDELLCRLLECDPITDIHLERLLTRLRAALLDAAIAEGDVDEQLLGFYCSLSRQCFINEYVFSITDEEAEDARRLRGALEAKVAAGESCAPLWLAAVGAYFPLHELANAQALIGRDWSASIDALLVQQVVEPAQERDLAATIPALTAIEDSVSQAVRQQYEESPYPRWTRLGPPAQPAALFALPASQLGDALIAGCGTGLSTIEFARHARGARILAIDLSLASLAYAKRMAAKAGLTNIEFAQADIVELTDLGRQFDFIDASGVLHHLADPWKGWRTLLQLLRPGGVMQLGLYSELARRHVVAARALIAARDYRPIAEDIRRCRRDIVAAEDPLLNSVSRVDDFFTTGECRDLLFHVQEHRTALPEIKSFLATHGLEFRGFFLDALTHNRFAARFPQPGAALQLDWWHTFETEAPDTFAGMYQFSVRKPGADPPTAANPPTAAKPRETGGEAN
jgi:2-polyprenyl-3-methyl-5-hydroxy-6-metoxy-1,4-benzoquinol methylase